MARDQIEAECRSRHRGSEDDVRVLRRVDLPTGHTGCGTDTVSGFGVVVDVETTGFDHEHDGIIELAARRFAYDEEHVITRLDRPFTWREDPHQPLSDEIIRMTGLADSDLAGRRIDEAEAARIIGSADVRIAHNASFGRPFVERRLPAVAGLPWACSMADVNWIERGFESAKLGPIMTHCGFFHEAHRAVADVDAVIQILRHELEPGRTALKIMMDQASTNGWIVRAFGAAFAHKDVLRARRYRWNPQQRVWWKEVRDREAEEAWLLNHVYSSQTHQRSGSPDFERVDWRTRYE